MKYLALLSKFWKFNEKTPIGYSCIALYTYLIHKWFQSDCKPFTISDLRISKELKIKEKTIRVIKKKLEELQLIQYESKVGCPCVYSLVKDDQIITKVRKNSENKSPKAPNDPVIIISPVEPTAISQENIPSMDEFLSYAKTLKNYTSDINSKIEEKYKIWIKNEWKNNYGRPITNWKSSLKSTMQFIIDSSINEEQLVIPIINKPNTKNDENKDYQTI